ncbi:phosphate uptake regulator PhoU [Halorarum salinum]|uniref:AbrB/MazE/SpoVT family DNA-binding domain-containing protein n=1 Tax=Halorarum salinum TaxID=2743089 RepID=A0A7D5LA35_9EURY|nr:phosphate uptake regulator PhoU [Halobaculum salinum]QLG61694.1 AbrB/MazE/SpoVT family DNA-binding domain-containing protein [Halobaculum salinum]
METRKVQRLGPSTLAMTLPAEWAQEHHVEKGDEVSLRMGGKGTLTVLPESASTEDAEATLHVDNLDAGALERAILAQYVLGRRVINITAKEGALDSDHINAVYKAETQLMGLGVIEETPENIAIRCSVDPEDFALDNLLGRLENTGSTMRGEAVKALAHGNPDLAQRALNRERQANKIFVLLLRLIFTAYQNPNLARAVGLESGFPLIGYRSVAKNLELIADNAEDIAEIVMEADDHTLDVESSTMRQIREMTDQVNDITAMAVESIVQRDYSLTIEVRYLFRELKDRERDILDDLPEMENEQLLRVREVLVSLQETAQYAMRIAEVAANLSLNEENEHVSIE